MWANFSSIHNSSLDSTLNNCTTVKDFQINDAAYYITRAALIAPLTFVILYLAYQRWRQQGSWTAVSHCDIFTYHLAIMELFTIVGTAFTLWGYFSRLKTMARVGQSMITLPYCGETLFHNLTCLERYMAVVHPHTYRGLKSARGVRIRNVIVGCAWLFSSGWMVAARSFSLHTVYISILSIMVISLVIVSFCSLSVLCALVGSKPGERGQGKERVDQSKQKAFFTITVILGVLSVWFIVFISALFLNTSTLVTTNVKCVVMGISFWFCLPSSLVLPLLYLQRTGKLSFCLHTGGRG